MWIKEINVAKLRNQEKWSVEPFRNEIKSHFQSVYPLAILGDLVELRKDSINPQDAPDTLFNYVGLENVESLTGDLINFESRFGREIRSRSKIFYADDILYGRLRPYLNKVYLACGRVSSGICSTEFYVLIPDSQNIRPHILRAILSSKNVLTYISNLQSGSALPRMDIDDLLGIKIPCPPFDAQLEIEDYLVQQNKFRQRMARKLAKLPQTISDSVVHSLENGQPLEIKG
jgi:restriction endonuclease S subunit